MSKEELTVMVVDASARAHAVSEAYERSPNVKKIIVTPGNDFIGYNRKKEVVIEPGKLTDSQSFLAVAQKHKPDLVDVCQDDALAVGTVNLLKENGFNVFGPSKEASQLEWDKKWSRDFMRDHCLPHPFYKTFSTLDCDSNRAGRWFMDNFYKENPGKLMFVKAAGLCGGKGAIPTTNIEEAHEALQQMVAFTRAGAGETYLIEEGMIGEEASVYSFCDGKIYRTLKPAQDHKRRDNFDLGPNTGGMGAVAPAGVMTKEMIEAVNNTIVHPAVCGMAKIGSPYVGVLYTGVMVTKDGPQVVEFNSRWGAPEAEVVVSGIKTPMDRIAFACIEGKLDQQEIFEDDKVRVCVVGASRGYPGDVSAVKGKRIYGLEEAMRVPGVRLYGAGIVVRDGKFYANGGRLVSVSAEGDSYAESRSRALTAMAQIYIEGSNLQYRTDIGWRDMERALK